MYYATYYGRLKVVKHLKEKYDIPYERSNNGTTCLHVAVRRGYTKLVHFFLKKLKESEKEKMNIEVLQFKKLKLWEEKIEADEQKNDGGLNSVAIAIKEKNLDMLKILRHYGADFDMTVTVGKGQSFLPFLLACKSGSVEIV